MSTNDVMMAPLQNAKRVKQASQDGDTCFGLR